MPSDNAASWVSLNVPSCRLDHGTGRKAVYKYSGGMVKLEN